MADLERRLLALRDEIDWPDTPPLEPVALPDPRRIARPWRRVALVGVAVILAVAGAVLALSPGARSAFLEALHIRGAAVLRVDELPPVGVERLPLGERVSRAEAERRVGFRLVDVGDPDAIYVDRGTVALVYGDPDRPRLVLAEGRGRLWQGFLKKVTSADSRVESVRVAGEPGIFASGGMRVVMIVGRSGQIVSHRPYLDGSVLLWNRGPLVLRLESALTRDEAIELARSAR